MLHIHEMIIDLMKIMLSLFLFVFVVSPSLTLCGLSFAFNIFMVFFYNFRLIFCCFFITNKITSITIWRENPHCHFIFCLQLTIIKKIWNQMLSLVCCMLKIENAKQNKKICCIPNMKSFGRMMKKKNWRKLSKCHSNVM